MIGDLPEPRFWIVSDCRRFVRKPSQVPEEGIPGGLSFRFALSISGDGTAQSGPCLNI
jgi:hypothetical protein